MFGGITLLLLLFVLPCSAQVIDLGINEDTGLQEIRIELPNERVELSLPADFPDPKAAIQGATITVTPPGIRLSIPEKWLERYKQGRNNIHLSKQEREKVRNGSGEWDLEYGKIVNSIFPFEACALHAGGEGWGSGESVSYGDVQMRVYVLPHDKMKVVESIKTNGTLAVYDLSAETYKTKWNDEDGRYLLSIVNWYYDYGGTAHVLIHCIRIKDWTVAVVFMYCHDRRNEINAILDSLTIE